MAWLESFSLVMRSSISTLREKVEDPERMIHQLVIDMEEEMERIRASVAGAIADEILLGKKAAAAHEEANNWMERAKTALKRGDEKNAQAALEQKVLAEERAVRLDDEHAKQKVQTAKLHQAVRDLDDKIRQARQKQTMLLARLARADSATKINRALDHAAGKSAFAQFSRLEKRVERAEAMSDAYDRLEDRDPDAQELERQFAEQDRQERMQQELADLKQKMAEQS